MSTQQGDRGVYRDSKQRPQLECGVEVSDAAVYLEKIPFVLLYANDIYDV